jgi:sodium transport system permease protein
MKEGGTYIVPVYIIVVIIGIASIQMDPTGNLHLFFIPFVNGVFALKEILVSQVSLLHMAVTVVTNLVFTVVIALLISRLYNSERILKTV